MDKDKTLTALTSTDAPVRTPHPRPPHEAEREAESLRQYASRLRSAAGGGHAVSHGTGRRSRQETCNWGALDSRAAEPFCTKSATALGKEVNPSPSTHGKAHQRRRTKLGPERTLVPRRPQTRAARRDHTPDCWRRRSNNHSDPGSKLRPHGASADEHGEKGRGKAAAASRRPCSSLARPDKAELRPSESRKKSHT